ncbi:MAG: manganese efflux pump [Bacteroidales bacterium]|nr:manganese efflux pump [Bacteroidales bacterium]
MTNIELLILAVSLTFDTFAVSVGGGISMPNMKLSKKAMVIAFFGIFQAAYLFTGWFIGGKAANFILEWDHWVAFIILTYLGGKMLFEAIKRGNEEQQTSKRDFLCIKRLAVLATATSIDAIAVGASLAMLQISTTQIAYTTFCTFAATATASYIGLQGGSRLGYKAGKKAEIWGGVILIVIGMKILIEHMEYMG